jgi:ABC-type polysaccharide/polyol phosphate export permease
MRHCLTDASSIRAWSDLRATFTDNYVWRALGRADIRSKHRYTRLGSLWITLSTGVSAFSIGLIYGQFFGQDVSTYLPYFVAGMVAWTFMASVLNEATQALISAGTWIKGSNLPISFYVMRMVQRNFLIFLHNLAILVLVWLYFRWSVPATALLAVPGLAIVYVCIVAWAVIIAFACVRYRDVPPMVGALTQFVFFASPILWFPEQLKIGTLLLWLNPVAYLIVIVRDPVLGRPVSLATFAVAMVITLVSLGLAVLLYRRYRDRVAYWV